MPRPCRRKTASTTNHRTPDRGRAFPENMYRRNIETKYCQHQNTGRPTVTDGGKRRPPPPPPQPPQCQTLISPALLRLRPYRCTKCATLPTGGYLPPLSNMRLDRRKEPPTIRYVPSTQNLKPRSSWFSDNRTRKRDNVIPGTTIKWGTLPTENGFHRYQMPNLSPALPDRILVPTGSRSIHLLLLSNVRAFTDGKQPPSLPKSA